MEIIKGTPAHISAIRTIAEKTWADTYSDILVPEQIAYMLGMMYSADALMDQMLVQNHHFVLIKEKKAKDIQGFVSYQLDCGFAHQTKLHKLYVLPQCQGLGMGRKLISKVCEEALNKGNKWVRLNMNRKNKTLDFYKHIGFEIVGEENIDIGNGFLMEDYIFEKKIID